MEEITAFIKKQIGVDIEKYRNDATRRFDTETLFNIDWSEVPKSEQRALQMLHQRWPNKFNMEKSGVWLMTFWRTEGDSLHAATIQDA